MGSPEARTLAEWEELLTPLFKGIRLIGELPLGDIERVHLAQRIRALVTSRGLSRATDFLEDLYPRAFVTYLALTAARNEERGFWDVVAQEVGVPQAGQFFHPRHHWGKLFLRLLEDLGLETFADVPTGTEYVTRIRLHGGIPAYSLPDFFEYILLPAVERPEYVGLPAKDLLGLLLQGSEVRYFVDRVVRLFLLEAGDVALDFFRRCLEMARTWKRTGDVPPAHEVGLPTYVVDMFHDFVDGRLERGKGAGLRPPRLYIDPYAPDALYFLDLPSQPIAASRTDWRYLWRWEVKSASGRSQRMEKAVRVTRQGDRFWTHAVEMVPLDVSPGQLAVTFVGRTPEGEEYELRHWHFPLTPDERRPVLVFRSKDGRFLAPRATIPAAEVWLLIPAAARVEVIGQGRLVEKFPQMYGEWAAWRVEAWDLEKARGIRLLDEQGQDLVPPIPTSRVDVEPELISAPPPWHECDPEERPLFVGEVPWLSLPRMTALSPREEMSRWRLEIRRQGYVISHTVMPETSLLSYTEHVDVEENAFVVRLDELLDDDVAGIFEVEVRGPSLVHKHLSFRVWPHAAVESLPPYILPEARGHTDITFRLHVPPDATVQVQAGVEDVSVSRADQPGTFLVRVGKERAIVPLILIRGRGAGMPDRVPIHIGIPRLRWLLALEEEEEPAQPQASVISRPIAALLQSRRVYLILDWTIAVPPDRLPAMRLALVDPSERTPRRLQECEVAKPRPGQHRQVIPLEVFRDTIRAHQDLPLLSFDLVVLDERPRQLPLVHLTRAPDVDRVEFEWREDGKVYVHWHEPRPLRHRRLNLWPISQPWREPLQVRVPDAPPTSDLYTDEGWWMQEIGTHADVPPGVYQVSFSTAHAWEPLQPPPEPPEEAFLVVGVDVNARLRELISRQSVSPDSFFAWFEQAALCDYLGDRSGREQAVRALLNMLPQLPAAQIIAFVRWLEKRDPLGFKAACVKMYHPDVMEAKGIWSEKTPSSLRRDYMQWFVNTRLLRVNALERVLESPGDVEWKVHALEVLLKKDVEKAVFYGLLLLDEGILTMEDLLSVFAPVADDVVRELRHSYPERREIIEALVPHLTHLTAFCQRTLVETEAGVGIIEEVEIEGQPVPWAFADDANVVVKVRLLEEELADREEAAYAIIDYSQKKIVFPRATQVFRCLKCQRLIPSYLTFGQQASIDRHDRKMHPDTSPYFVMLQGNEAELRCGIRVLKAQVTPFGTRLQDL